MRLFATFLAAAVLCSASPAQTASAKHVRVSSNVSGGSVLPGNTFNVEVKLTVGKGWHVNSHTPAQEYMIPTVIVIDSTEGFAVTGIQYPKGQSVSLSISDTPFSVYDGTVAIVVSLTASANLAPGKKTLNGTITLQACNNQICVAPSTIRVSIPVTVGS